MGETLLVRCRRCGKRFAAPEQFDRAALASMTFTVVYRCPRCGHRAAYSSNEHAHELIVPRS